MFCVGLKLQLNDDLCAILAEHEITRFQIQIDLILHYSFVANILPGTTSLCNKQCIGHESIVPQNQFGGRLDRKLGFTKIQLGIWQSCSNRAYTGTDVS